MNVIHRQHLAPSGVEHACQLSITPSTVAKFPNIILGPTRARVITNLAVARSTLLNVYELCQLDDPFPSEQTEGQIRKATYKLFHVCEHRLHGKVTGLQKIVTLDTAQDGLDRLLISFEDAKMTLLEWSSLVADLVPISLHTFEKLPQITQGDLPRDYQAQLETDPLSRCAVLLLPQATLAVLPFFQDQLDLDGLVSAPPTSPLGVDQQRFQTFPYAPSFIIDFNQQLLNHQASISDQPQRPIKSVIAVTFLPGFSEPTLAVLYQCQWTWSARLENGTDTTALVVLTLDIGSNHFPIISHTQKLPYDAHGLVACPKELGGVLVLCADMILHVDQSSKIIGVATNGWVKHTSELKIPRQETIEIIQAKDLNSDRAVTHPPSDIKMDLEDGEEDDATRVPKDHETLLARLENSKIVFFKLDLALVFLRNGQVFSLQFERDGRTLLKLRLEKFPVRSVVPSTVVKLNEQCLFVGSMSGDSTLFAIDELRVKAAAEWASIHPHMSERYNTEMDIDVDDDIYGDQKDPGLARQSDSSLGQSRVHPTNPHKGVDVGKTGATHHLKLALRSCDSLSAHGPIRDYTMAATGSDNMSLDLLACTGAGDLGGLTVFNRGMPVRKRRRLGSNEQWGSRLQFTSHLPRSESSIEHTDLIWLSRRDHQTDVLSFSASNEPLLITTLPSPTLVASTIFGGKLVVQVTNTHIKLLTPDLKEVQVIQPEPPMKIEQAMVMDDSVLLQTNLRLVLVYQGDPESQTLSKLPFPSSTPIIRTATFLKAELPMISNQVNSNASPSMKKHLSDPGSLSSNFGSNSQAGKEDIEMKVDQTSTDARDSEPHCTAQATSSSKQAWLLTTDEKGNFYIHNLTKLEIVFTANRIDTLPENLGEEEISEDVGEPTEFFGEADVPSEPEAIEQIFAFSTGAMALRPHVAVSIPFCAPIQLEKPQVMLATGAFAVYQLVTSYTTSEMITAARDGHPAILLKKVLGRQFEALENPDSYQAENPKMEAVSEVEKPMVYSRSFRPFNLQGKLRGAFLSGCVPIWLVSTDHGPCRIYESVEETFINDVAQSPSGSLICLVEAADSKNKNTLSTSYLQPQTLWEAFVSEYVCFDREVPSTLVKTGRPFNKVVYDNLTETVVGASYLETAFANFDEEGNLMWQPDDDSLVRPTTFRSSLELILPGSWVTIDGYEFQQNEWVTSMESIDLDSRSTVYGRRPFIGVGTTCNRAEDLAARGGVYVFEVIYVNSDDRHPERNRGLRLRYHEETKACVTAVDAINGYFLHTMGQKLYAKCFEQDERLLAVGFLDIKPYATCLRIFKNFMLLGDAVKGVTLVAFQEEPYKLIELGHTYVDYKCSTVDFLVIDAKMAIVTTDLDGTIRIFEYNPTNIESQAGQKLLCRTEYHAAGEMAASMQFGKRLSPKEEAKVVGTLYAGLDGSISSLVPTKDAVYKRLQLVSSRLTRHIQHFAGLNPRGFRTVRNDMVSRAINRGILDGELLAKFELLSVNQQKEIASLAGSDRETVLINLTNLRSLCYFQKAMAYLQEPLLPNPYFL